MEILHQIWSRTGCSGLPGLGQSNAPSDVPDRAMTRAGVNARGVRETASRSIAARRRPAARLALGRAAGARRAGEVRRAASRVAGGQRRRRGRLTRGARLRQPDELVLDPDRWERSGWRHVSGAGTAGAAGWLAEADAGDGRMEHQHGNTRPMGTTPARVAYAWTQARAVPSPTSKKAGWMPSAL